MTVSPYSYIQVHVFFQHPSDCMQCTLQTAQNYTITYIVVRLAQYVLHSHISQYDWYKFVSTKRTLLHGLKTEFIKIMYSDNISSTISMMTLVTLYADVKPH